MGYIALYMHVYTYMYLLHVEVHGVCCEVAIKTVPHASSSLNVKYECSSCTLYIEYNTEQ